MVKDINLKKVFLVLAQNKNLRIFNLSTGPSVRVLSSIKVKEMRYRSQVINNTA
jgi:hypothetical protein